MGFLINDEDGEMLKYFFAKGVLGASLTLNVSLVVAIVLGVFDNCL